MNELSVALKIISEHNCPYYDAKDLFLLTGQAVQVPNGHPSCLIMVREITELLFKTFIPAAETGLDELKSEVYTCGGCTGLIKFQIEESPEGIEHQDSSHLSDEDMVNEDVDKQPRPIGRADGVVVSGLLAEISLSELLQFFHMHQKTGKLVIEVADGTGRVAYRDGAIIGAKFQEHEDKEAVFALLRENRGKFSFINGIPSALSEVAEVGDFMMLLMEGIKRMDEDEGK